MNFRSSITWVWIVAPVVLLVALSLLTLRSIDIQTTIQFNFAQQILGLLVGLLLGAAAFVLGKDFWRRSSYAVYGVSIVLLLLTLSIGDTAGGAQRWLEVGPIRFQTSELVKVALILVQARLLSQLGERINSVNGFAASAAVTLLAAGLVALQPDLGTAITLVVIWVILLAFSKLSKMWLLGFLAVCILILPLVSTNLAPYQRERLTSFLSVDPDSSDAGYNVEQAQIAISSGGAFGQGLDGGTQSQLEFIPSQHTDFIFSVITEKLGAAGGLIIIGSLLAVTGFILVGSARSPDEFARLLLAGVAALIGFQFVINIGMNLGLAPVTGLPLPFVSYGSTHLIVELAMLGIAFKLMGRRQV